MDDFVIWKQKRDYALAPPGKQSCKLYNKSIQIETLNHNSILNKLFYHYYYQHYIQPKLKTKKKYYIAPNQCEDIDIGEIIIATSDAEAVYLYVIKDNPHSYFDWRREMLIEWWEEDENGDIEVIDLIKEIINDHFGDNYKYAHLFRIHPELNIPTKVKYITILWMRIIIIHNLPS